MFMMALWCLGLVPVADLGGGPGGLGPTFQNPAKYFSLTASRSQTFARMSGYVRLRLAVQTAYIYM